MESALENFCLSLYNAGCVKFGEFTLKSGRVSSYYIDLRLLIAHPCLMTDVTNLIHNVICTKKMDLQTICGVPYTALPISTMLCVKLDKPMVLRRKEPKSYGTKQLIEGKFKKGDRCIIIEDVISTGTSILETVQDVESVGLVVEDVIAIVDREEGGLKRLTDRGFNVHCLFNLSQITKILFKKNCLTAEFVKKIEDERKSVISSLSSFKSEAKLGKRTRLPFEERIQFSKSEAVTELFTIMVAKKTNLCVAADVPKMDKLLTLADELGPYVCVFKIHSDIIECYSEKERDELKKLAARHNFLIMEDRKLADIGNTVRLQFNQLSKWASLVTAHSVSGFGILEGIKNSECYSPSTGVFLIAELSSKNNLITADYTKKTVELAENYRQVVAGFVSQTSVCEDPGMIQLTPGVCLEEKVKNDALGQQYRSPETIMLEDGADIAVVGRGIINASCPAEAAKLYKKKLWDIYLSRVSE